MTGEKPQALAAKMESYNFSKFKSAVAEIVTAKIAPITGKYNRLTTDHSYIMEVLKNGAEAAGIVAEKQMKQVKEIIGFI